jgi:hypothetical protein
MKYKKLLEKYIYYLNFKTVKKLIHHTWDEVIPTSLLKHKKCSRCLCQKFYSPGFGKLIYQDRFGNIYPARTPSCELPNIKI